MNLQSFKEHVFILKNGIRWMTYEAIIVPESDFFLKIKSQAEQKIHFSPNSSQSGKNRSLKIKYQNQLRGSLAEAYAKLLIEEYASFKNINVSVVRYDDVLTSSSGFSFDTIKGEYDIKVYIDESVKLLECRSSVAHSISFSDAIQCYDTIGRYTHFKKPTESFNDFYIRPLYEYHNYNLRDFYSHDFETLLKQKKISLHFTGGADLTLMDKKGYNKSMGQGGTNYRVIKIIDGFSIAEFLDRILLKTNSTK